MRIHLPAPVPHRDPNPDWEPCAFTGKAWRLARMLVDLGHTVFVYGGPDVDCLGADTVEVISAADRARWFGPDPADILDRWNTGDPCWAETNAATIAAIAERIEPYDIVGITAGTCQQPIADAFPNHVRAEVGIGYEAPMLSTHWCVESEAWRHYLYGRYGVTDGRWYDTVIPNAYDPTGYLFSARKEPFLLYMGRMTARKGLGVVADLAKDHFVVTAGPGDERVPGATHAGVVTGREKAELLASATALVAPSIYVEPFGGVAIEAMLSGTPVLASPFGAFTETVTQGVTGWRCHTLAEFHRAAGLASELDPKTIRDHTAERYSLDAVAPRYSWWLDRLAGLYGAGWYG
jgi:glycosyltransferase involved in cell wall biosynthesis